MASGTRITSTTYDRPHRPLPIRLLNAGGRGLGRLGWRGVDLDARSLLAAACARTGLTDFGEPTFRERLDVLLHSLRNEAALHPVGRLMARENLIRVLATRLRIRALLERHAAITTQPVTAPIFIVGLQRTGTTLLQRLLSCDPRLRVLASWEAISPAPLVPRDHPGRDPRIRQAALAERALTYLAPDFFAIHPVEADAPEEDCLLFDFGFWSTVPEATQRVPSFSTFLERQDHHAAYREHREVLQLLWWQRSAERWLLKSPQHLEHLDALLATYPDARILQTHRDPAVVLASFSSMMAHSRGVFTDRVDPAEVARHWFRKARRMITRSADVRADAPADTFCDVAYQDLVRDPLAELRRVYEFLGLELGPDVLARMERWRGTNPQHKHGRHRYRLQDFGLTRAEVSDAFEGYRRRHDIPEEKLP